MPQVDIGPFTGTVGPADAKETVTFIRVGSFTSNTVRLPEDVKDVASVLVHVSELLQKQESSLAELILSFRQGEVGFEQDDNGNVVRWYFKYPDWSHVEDTGVIS